MARTAAERRAARKRKQQERHGRRGAGPQPESDRIGSLVAVGAASAVGPDADPGLLEDIVAALASADPAVDTHGHLARMLTALLAELWEAGWQPADVAHVLRLRGTARHVELGLAVVAAEAAASRARDRAPEDWRAQLTALGVTAAPDGGPVASWRAAQRLPAADAWRAALTTAGLLGALGPLQVLGPPPSRWGRDRQPTRTGHAGARQLERIRALLAKAESTDFPEEAEALSGKAQELMTRHAIDAALLAAHGERPTVEVIGRRVHVDNPYPEPKVRLLDAVATANGARVVYLQDLGMATVVGARDDLDGIDLLVTSLLVQATRAMTATGRAGGRRDRSPAFRRAFLTAYAVRIGERLVAARDRITADAVASGSSELVPVLRARSEAVDGAFAAMFPETHGVESRAYDARGWYAGRAAADDADLGSHRDGLPD